jgi:hypothetical protein
VEEELGQLRQLGHSDNAICSRCGKPFATQAPHAVPPGAVEAAPQDFPALAEPLCPDCAADVAGGEIELPLDLE